MLNEQEIDQNIIEETKGEIQYFLEDKNLMNGVVLSILNREYNTIEDFACTIRSNNVIYNSGALNDIYNLLAD